ncbi:MAG: hypothetical protein ACKOUQ_08440, partial [Aquirufa sp.]
MTPAKLTLLQTELGMFTYGDLIQYFPFRYEDRTVVHPIASITEEMDHAQFVGRIRFKEKIGAGHRQRIVAQVCDATGCIEIVWFQGVKWLEKSLVRSEVALASLGSSRGVWLNQYRK